jgi:putative transposase
MYLWRAVDAEGEVLDCLVQSRRNKRAALRLMRKPIRKYRMVPSKFVSDRLPSYAAARAELPVTICTRERLATKQSGRELACSGAATRAKNKRFRSAGSAQRFLSAHACRRGRCSLKRHSSAIRSTKPDNVTNPPAASAPPANLPAMCGNRGNKAHTCSGRGTADRSVRGSH